MIRSPPLEQVQLLRAHKLAHGMADAPVVGFGVDAIDQRIGGGLMQRAVHEIFAVSPDDASAAAAFAVMLSMRARPAGRPVVWIRERRCAGHGGRLHAVGLVELGCDPDMVILVDAPDTLAVLRAAGDAVKCDQVGAVVIEPWGKAPLLDLTATRRLAMSAATSAVFTLVLRVDAEPLPSAAQTRWQVAAAPSTALAANAPGLPSFDIALLRHRGGIAGFEVRLEWNRDTASFALLSGRQPAMAGHRADQARKAA